MSTSIQKADVNTPSLAYADMEQARKLPRTLMGGTTAMRAAGPTYLPQEPAESAANYANRLARSVLYNAYKKAVQDLVGKVFSKPLHPKDDVPEDMKAWLENIDLAGNDFTAFVKAVFLDSFLGVSYILVDFPRVEAGGTLADERKIGARPYCVHVPCGNLIGWKSARINGVETLTQARIRETSVETDGDWGEKAVSRVRVLDLVTGEDGKPRCAYTVWELQQGEKTGNQWVPRKELSGVMSVGFIPIVPVYTERTDFMAGKPPLADLADLNCLHWQKWSDANQIEHVASVPILFYRGYTPPANEGAGGVVEVGPNKMIRETNPEAALQFVEHTGAAIGSNRESLRDLEERMGKMAMDPMVSRPGTVTATEKSIDTSQAHCSLQAWAWGLQDSLELVLQYMGAWVGKKPEACGGVDVNSDFGLSVTDMTMAELTQAYQAGLFSRETVWEELQRRGRLADDFDPEAERDRLMTQSRDGTFQTAATRFLNPGATPGQNPPAAAPQSKQGEAA
jgi:hypothetical protein